MPFSRGVSRCSERLAKAGIEPSIVSKGDSHDNSVAEAINGSYKAEMIHRQAPCKTPGIGGTGDTGIGVLV